MTDRQMFKLVDANTVPSNDGSCGCGCGGEGKKADAARPDASTQAPVEQAPGIEQAPDGCGCGGHGEPVERPFEMAAEPIASTAGGCGCGGNGGGHGHGHGHGGGHGHGHGKVHAGGAGVIHRPDADELVIHSIPRVVRHAVLFAAVDNLPVGENIQICAPHQPEPLFAHLQDSEQHYRVETLEVGPVDWRYRITRLA